MSNFFRKAFNFPKLDPLKPLPKGKKGPSIVEETQVIEENRTSTFLLNRLGPGVTESVVASNPIPPLRLFDVESILYTIELFGGSTALKNAISLDSLIAWNDRGIDKKLHRLSVLISEYRLNFIIQPIRAIIPPGAIINNYMKIVVSPGADATVEARYGQQLIGTLKPSRLNPLESKRITATEARNVLNGMEL